jgi:hypothetical protein
MTWFIEPKQSIEHYYLKFRQAIWESVDGVTSKYASYENNHRQLGSLQKGFLYRREGCIRAFIWKGVIQEEHNGW